jgi:Zn-dependent protease with chaperone function
MRRALATVLTLGLLSSFVFAVVVGLMLAFGTVSLAIAIALVVLFNFGMLLVSPRINDFVYRYLYDMEWVDLAEFRERSPASARVIEEVTAEYGYDTPKLGLIADRNPNAFTYGSARFNARVVLTEGCFEYLDDEEVASVVAHELGHVTSRDFIVMTLANTLVQVLYLVAVYAWRFGAATGSGSGGGRNRAAPILFGVAILAYVLWFFGEYIVLYLSRVREYAADGFAARWTHPDALSSALVKIAYGIVTSEDSPELAKATRNIGIMDVANSRDDGLVYHNVREAGGDEDLLLRSFLYDLKNPWARVLELNSTHPLTGKRVRALSRMEGASRFDFADILSRFEIDRGRMYRGFFKDVGMLALPGLLAVGYPLLYLGSVLVEAVAFSWFWLAGGWLAAFGVGQVALALYKYPRSASEPTTVIEALADPYASPVRGQPVELDGALIGRGQAGYRFSEDLMFQDRTGLMYLKYESWLPLLGNFLFALRRVPELIGEEVEVEGWFLRGTGPWVGMRRLRHGDETIRGFIHYGGLVSGALLLVVGLAVVGAGAVL